MHLIDPTDPTTKPVRVQLLLEGAKLTSGDRNKTYGDPIDNFTLAGNLKRMFWRAVTRKVGPAEEEAINQIITKLARLAGGREPHKDTYIDGAVYFACAGEVAEMEYNNKNQKIGAN